MAEKKKGFDLAEALGAVSNLDTGAAGREQIQYIHVEHIKPDERNFYELGGIDELAASIEFTGLQQPLRVRPGEQEGEYIIVSGHRRHAAIKQMILESQELYERFCEVPCIVEKQSGATDEVEAMLQELRLIYGNSDTRQMSSADISKQAERVEMLLYQLKEAGVEFPGKMRDHVAEACKVSAPKLARLKVIREGLIPDYKAEWEAGNLVESCAYVLARFPADFQTRLFSALKNLNGHVSTSGQMERVLRQQAEGWDWNPCLTCPDGKACKRGDVFLRRDCSIYGYEALCGGKTCCLECELAKRDGCPCDQMCSKAKAARSEKNAAKKDAEAKARKRQEAKYQRETRVYAQRLLKAIDAAGLKDTTKIPWEYDNFSVKEIRAWANGDFSTPHGWYDAELNPKRCTYPLDTAKVLKCSTDWLLGLTEELTPRVEVPAQDPAPQDHPAELDPAPEAETAVPEALPGSPADPPSDSGKWVLLEWISPARKPENGQMVALEFDFCSAGKRYQLGRWVDGEWCFASSGAPMSSQPTGWFPLPPNDDEMSTLDTGEE